MGRETTPHKLTPAGKDCTAEAAALFRSMREQAREEIARDAST